MLNLDLVKHAIAFLKEGILSSSNNCFDYLRPGKILDQARLREIRA
jgi:hypothetical protein